jgi:hypothetical protein
MFYNLFLRFFIQIIIIIIIIFQGLVRLLGLFWCRIYFLKLMNLLDGW